MRPCVAFGGHKDRIAGSLHFQEIAIKIKSEQRGGASISVALLGQSAHWLGGWGERNFKLQSAAITAQ